MEGKKDYKLHQMLVLCGGIMDDFIFFLLLKVKSSLIFVQ